MPTYNYRLTGRDISTLSPVESSDRVLLWGSDAIHCGHPNCKFEICAVGGENVLGGAMQEGWGFDQAVADQLKAEFEKAGPGALGIGRTTDEPNLCPWRCAIHLTKKHKPITLEMIAERCPGPPSPEYQRGHADGFEQAQRAIQTRPAMPVRTPSPEGGVMEFPNIKDIEDALEQRGGLHALVAVIQKMQQVYFTNNNGITMKIAKIGASSLGVPEIPAITLLIMGIIVASIYFNDKYAGPIEDEAKGQPTLQ